MDEGWRVRKDGQQFWANVVITALLDKDGCLQGFAKITRDLTERHRAERVLSDKNIELQNAIDAKVRFLANVSHELRTPLNGILGFAECLVDGKPGTLNPKQKEYLEDILNSGKHLLELINDVLDLIRFGGGKMVLNPEQFSLRKTIEEVCAVAKPIADKKTIHTSGGRCAGARFKLEVKDTGIGIKGEDLQRIFQEFEQVDSGMRRGYEGTGLGLALTRKLVELQGGTIGVESEVGRGSLFTVVLPLVLAETNA